MTFNVVKGTLMSEEEYNYLRGISQLVSYSKAVKLQLTSRSAGTWDRIMHLTTWEDYKKSNEAHRIAQIKTALLKGEHAKQTDLSANGKTEAKSDILTEGNVLLENTILLQSINRLQGSIDTLVAKIETLSTRDQSIIEKIFRQ